MKFALVALIASVSAIKITASAGCPSQAEIDGAFDKFDTNHNGLLGPAEAMAGLKAFHVADAAGVEKALNEGHAGGVNKAQLWAFVQAHMC